ncbi:hypothetical protein DV735_g5314, partial [Chaetothyriales sp. CBS 134920]
MAAPTANPLPRAQRAVQCAAAYDIRHAALSAAADLPAIPQSGVYTLVKVISAALNPADYKLLHVPWPIPRLLMGPLPVTPGADFVGRVWLTTHPDLQPGDLVWGKLRMPTKYGTCAEFTLHTGEQGIAKLAGVGIAGLTALHALKKADLPYKNSKNNNSSSRSESSGGKVFINGASGGVGTFAVQMAKAIGCETVVASCSAANADLVRSLGADEVIDYRSQDVVEALRAWSKKGGQGGQKFDAIIDNIGSNLDIYWNSEDYLKADGGAYIAVSVDLRWASLAEVAKILLWPSWLGGGKRPFHVFMLLGTQKEDWDLIGKWLVAGKVRTVIEDENRFALSEIQSALQKLQTGRTRGKIIVTVAGDGQ